MIASSASATETAVETDRVRWLSDDEQRSWRAFVTACSLLMRQFNADMLASNDLSMDDYAILAMLSEADQGRLRFGELAEILRVPKAHITYRFRRLEDRHLVLREACPTDARGAFAVLTDDGRERIITAAPDHVESVRARLLDHLTAEQLDVIGEAMSAVMQAQSDQAPLRR